VGVEKIERISIFLGPTIIPLQGSNQTECTKKRINKGYSIVNLTAILMKNDNLFFEKPQTTIQIYSDGFCEPNPGEGGYGAIIIYPDGTEKRICDGVSDTTNNRMELLGAIVGIEEIKGKQYIALFSDSKYVVNGTNKWLYNWKKKGRVMKNMDLWDRIWNLKKKHNIDAFWVPGHSGIKYNEIADQLSEEGYRKNIARKQKNSSR